MVAAGLGVQDVDGLLGGDGAGVVPVRVTLDADDLWHPDKTRLQLAALAAAGDRAALAYGWFRRVDEQGRVLPVSPYPTLSGRVLHRHIDWNFISNGSTPLIRRSALGDVRYDPGLNAVGAEPELTLGLLATAHAVVFLLGADTGVTRSPAMSRQRVPRRPVASTHTPPRPRGETP